MNWSVDLITSIATVTYHSRYPSLLGRGFDSQPEGLGVAFFATCSGLGLIMYILTTLEFPKHNHDFHLLGYAYPPGYSYHRDILPPGYPTPGISYPRDILPRDILPPGYPTTGISYPGISLPLSYPYPRRYLPLPVRHSMTFADQSTSGAPENMRLNQQWGNRLVRL